MAFTYIPSGTRCCQRVPASRRSRLSCTRVGSMNVRHLASIEVPFSTPCQAVGNSGRVRQGRCNGSICSVTPPSTAARLKQMAMHQSQPARSRRRPRANGRKRAWARTPAVRIEKNLSGWVWRGSTMKVAETKGCEHTGKLEALHNSFVHK